MLIKPKNLRSTEATTFKEAIDNWLKSNHLGEKLLISRINAEWETLVGPVISRHTKSLKVENKVLHIVVDNAPLRQQLTYSKTQIIKLVNERAGKQLVIDCFIL
jgi:predicted nucleic acid-binding Zn ribbon protein